MYIIILPLVAMMPNTVVAGFVSIVAVLSIVNFLPITRRAGGYGLLASFFLISTITLCIIAGFYHPFTNKIPYRVYVNQHYSAISNETTLTLSADPYAPYAKSRDINDIMPKFSYDITKDAQCSSISCTIPSKKPKDIEEMTFQIDKFDRQDKKTIEIRFYTPGSYIQLFDITSPVLSVSVNENNIRMIKIYLIVAPAEPFYYYQQHANNFELLLEVDLDLNDALNMTLNVCYDMPHYSEEIDYLINNPPEAITFVGTANCLISYEYIINTY